MSEQALGVPRKTPRFGRLRPLPGQLAWRLRPSSRACWATAGLIVSGLTYRFWGHEGFLANILFTEAVTLALIAAVVLLTRRALFSTLAIAVVVALIEVAATAKHAVMNMVAHAYDIIFYLGSWSTISYLWNEQSGYLLAFAGALLVGGLTSWLAWLADGTRVPRRWAAAGLAACIGLAWVGADLKGERRHMQFYYEHLHVSSFYASWAETLETLWRGALIEAAPRAAALGRAFAVPTSCPTAGRPPHIVLIHEESVVQPSLFPTLQYDRSVDPFFISDDGRLHRLRVETYGGASWLTEFSLLAGVSTHSFGGMRQFVQTFTQQRLHDTLPQVLERCGYRNVVFYPMLRNFVSNDRFYASIGLKEIFDMRAQGARSVQERDRFYYANALAEIGRHLETSSKPLFTYIQTMSAHWPYNVAFEPDVEVPGGGPGTSPEMHEYLRRVSMAKMDFDFLMGELRRRFPRERFLVVHYGDHHPMATRTLLGYDADTEAEDVALRPNSLGFVTYFAMRGVNFRVPELPPFDTLDVPYLGTVILDAAGLPLSDAHRERMRLMLLCGGVYHDCKQHDEVLIFHRRLIESGVMAVR